MCVIEGVVKDKVVDKDIVRHICRILAREGDGGWGFSDGLNNPNHGTIIDPNKWEGYMHNEPARNGRGGYQSALVSVELADALVGMVWQLTKGGGGGGWGDIASLIEKGCRDVFRDTAISDSAIYDRGRGKAKGKAKSVAIKVRVRLLTAAIMIMRKERGEATKARMLEVCVNVINELSRFEAEPGRWGGVTLMEGEEKKESIPAEGEEER